MPAEAVDLVSRLLQYSPTLRFTAVSGRYSFSVDMAFMEIFHVIMKYYYMELKTKYHCSKPFCNLWMRPLDCSYSYIGFYILFQLEACAHPFFDDLRDPNACLPNGRPLPPLFNFGAEGEEWFVFVSLKLLTLWKFLRLNIVFILPELAGVPSELLKRLIPDHAKKWNLWCFLRVLHTCCWMLKGMSIRVSYREN